MPFRQVVKPEGGGSSIVPILPVFVYFWDIMIYLIPYYQGKGEFV